MEHWTAGCIISCLAVRPRVGLSVNCQTNNYTFCFLIVCGYLFISYQCLATAAHQWMPGLVMGSIDKNWYRYSIDTQISFQKSPSRTSHPEVRHLFRRISTFGLWIFSKSLGFFNICPVSALFQVTSFKFCSFFLGGGGHFWSLF